MTKLRIPGGRYSKTLGAIVHGEQIDRPVEAEDAYQAPALFEYGTIQEWTAGRLNNGLSLSLKL